MKMNAVDTLQSARSSQYRRFKIVRVWEPGAICGKWECSTQPPVTGQQIHCYALFFGKKMQMFLAVGQPGTVQGLK